MNEPGVAHVIAAYTIAALTLILYEVRLWGVLQALRRERDEGHGSAESPDS